MKEIQLTQGKVALVDDADYALLGAFTWCAHQEGPRWYALRRVGQSIVRMHRAILDTDAPAIDHINGDGLDNRRANLRPASKSLNALNARISRSNKSGTPGVHWDRSREKWMAYITINGKRLHLGRYVTLESAKAARATALQLYLEKEQGK